MIVNIPERNTRLELKVKKNTTIYSIKLAIQKKLSISKENLIIYLSGKQLSDNDTPFQDKDENDVTLTVSISDSPEKKEPASFKSEIKESDIKYFDNLGFSPCVITNAIITSHGDISKASDLLFNSRTVKVVSVMPIDTNTNSTDSPNRSDSENSSSDNVENTINLCSLINQYYACHGDWQSIQHQFPTIPVSTLHFILYWLSFNLQKCPQVFDLSIKTSKVKKLFIYFHQGVKVENLCKLIHIRDVSLLRTYYDIITRCICECDSLETFSKENPDSKIFITKFEKMMDQIEHLVTKKKEENHILSFYHKEFEVVSSPEARDIETDINGFFILPNHVINIPKLVSSFVQSGYSEKSLLLQYPDFSLGYLVYLLYLVHLGFDTRRRTMNSWRPKELRFLLEQGYEGASVPQMKEFLDEKDSNQISQKLKLVKNCIKNSTNFSKFCSQFKDFVVPSDSSYDDDGVPDYLYKLFDEFSHQDKDISVENSLGALTILLPDKIPPCNEIIFDHKVHI
ncbi:hypothetical protein TVAG_019490 [Trichomonas vaginalis G3]|uniref:Ubiquitin-like domain-containing protein n=1 Tax=Trichomonas vaginalis (strain ATCC PRA-98 / G3) TaxID=412133 RepID=A2DX22_TRIV3|nr:ubiquitin-like family [Trichomonas vaginalis G3]EAY15049.1 hypothetical protein TVAG_019490 [Trichomonas vaginalis G3]KAI5549590.1 ubiquitin-like family [Trichomonas vaginalis G3]|eukprot:XP_001327272.1 hypothetical protein [Trichomonas vaginalis G3]